MQGAVGCRKRKNVKKNPIAAYYYIVLHFTATLLHIFVTANYFSLLDFTAIYRDSLHEWDHTSSVDTVKTFLSTPLGSLLLHHQHLFQFIDQVKSACVGPPPFFRKRHVAQQQSVHPQGQDSLSQ